MDNLNQTIKGYTEASRNWNLAQLFSDLAEIKGQGKSRGLTHTEKELLCLVLIGTSPTAIATIRSTTIGSVKTELSTKIYDYANQLISQKAHQDKILDWRDVSRLLSRYYASVPPTPLDTEQVETLAPAIGWIRIGAVNSTSGLLPPAGSPLIPTAQPVTIQPMVIPKVRDIVAIVQYVNVREDVPREENNYQLAPIVGVPLPIGTRLAIVELAAFVDPNSSVPYTRIWSKIAPVILPEL